MSDETQDTAQDTIETEVTTDTPPAKKEKVFTQAEVNAIVAREKEAIKKSAGREKDTLSAVEANLRQDLSFYEDKFTAIIASQTADFDPLTLELFNALPLRDRMDKLGDTAFMGKVRRRNVIPETPISAGEAKNLFTRKTTV
jgi:hypothetical protein